MQEPADMVAYGSLGQVELSSYLPDGPARGEHL